MEYSEIRYGDNVELCLGTRPCLQPVVRPGRWTKTPYPRRLSAGGWSESFQKPGSPDDQAETLSSTLDGCLVG
ncbi:hypothetical protein K0M31_000433 [Melipona bicolor]|uniref:Uncharacterized protein n=1 Tax=Melipona bicolor TaxID=60889 RepID=A0AA40KWQ7_9HYME|nr:hypothetical protein K0M31_000433 [Melipona bicolor]